MNHFSIRLWCVMKVGQWWPAQWLNQEGAPKHFPKLNLHQKRSWSLFGGMWLVWTLVKPVHLRSMLSKSMTCTENCNACSWHWSTERALFSTTMPNCMLYNHHFKMDRIGLQSFASSSIFTWPLVNRLPILQASWQLFAGKMLPQPAGYRKCFPRVCQIPKHRFLCYKNKQIYFSLAKVCWL